MQGYCISVVVALVFVYAVCGIPFGVVLTKRFCHVDVRDAGSGNIGMTNVARVAGKLPAALTLLCDAGKGALSLGIAICVLNMVVAIHVQELIQFCATSQIFSDVYKLCMFVNSVVYAACVCGHIFSPYLHFKGGKGISVGFGAALVLSWQTALLALLAFFVFTIPSKRVSLGSLAAAIALPCWAYVFGYTSFELIPIIVVACLVIWAHRNNIARLIKGEEKPLKAKS